jgi:hypothetical protein
MGVHSKVGGNCDFPNPGEMLSVALASCLDTTTKVDARGTLRVDDSVPVGFQTIDVRIAEQQIGILLKAAERNPPQISLVCD